MNEENTNATAIAAQAIGWAYADCCVTLDNGGDPRQTEMSGVLDRAMKDLELDAMPPSLAGPGAAIDVLKAAMQSDPDYAHGWHCNIAMMCYDACRAQDNMTTSGDHEDAHIIGNDAASRFMKLLFGVETSA